MERLAQIKLQSASKTHNQGQLGVVLAAIEDTITTSNSPLIPTSYFASLLALLQTCVSGLEITNQEIAYPAVFLLDAITPEVPATVRNNNFIQIIDLLVPLLNGDDVATVRAAVGVLESLLKVQTLESWRTRPTIQSFKSLILLALNTKPKVRRRATEAVCAIITEAPQSLTKDSIAATTTVEEVMRVATNQVTQSEKGPLLHTLQLVKAVAGSVSWPVTHVNALCDLLLQGISNIGEGFVTVVAFEVFEKVFEQGSKDVDLARLQALLKTIVESKPSERDAAVLPSWLAVIGRGYELYAAASISEASDKVGGIFKLIFPLLQSETASIRKSCADCLQLLIRSCLVERKSNPTVQTIVTTVLRGLNSGARYRSARSEIFDIVKVLFGKLKSKANPILMESLTVLSETRQHLPDKTQIDAVLGAAIKAVGPEALLKGLPLNLTSGDGRAWLLPVLRDNVQNTKLSYFVNNLMPLAQEFEQRSSTAEIDAKIFKTVFDQIWASLPGFCDLPLDLPISFTRDFAEQLAKVLYAQPDLRSTICNSLQNLCLKPQQLIDCPFSEDELRSRYQYSRHLARSDLKHMSQFAMDFLSVLFNVYSQTLPEYRSNVLETIKAFLTICAPTDIQSAFSNVLGTLAENVDKPVSGSNSGTAEGISPAKYTIMDLLIVFIPHLSRVGLEMIWEICRVQLPAEDATMQKKAYKIFNTMSASDQGKAFLGSRIPQMQEVVLASKNVVASVRKERLAAMVNLMNFITSTDLHLIPAMLSEAVLCTKEQNEKARTMAYDLLVLMGQRMDAGGIVRMNDSDAAEANIQEFFVMVQAGLGSITPHMVSATVTALARLLYEFRDKLSPTFILEMLDLMEPILDSTNREVARSCLGFYKVVVISLPADLVVNRLQALVGHLLGWSHDHSRDFKSKVKHILERMVRRFGIAAIERCIPEADKKLLTNIRKTQERKKRNKKAEEKENAPRNTGKDAFEDAMQESDSSGSEESDAETTNGRTKSRCRGRHDKEQTFIQHTDEPMDLLDRSAMAHVSSTDPSVQRKQRSLPSERSKFKTNVDGKYIFADKEKNQKEETNGGSNTGDLGVMMEARKGMTKNAKGGVKFSNKRSRDDEDVEMEDVDDAGGSAKKQQRTDRSMRPKQEAPYKKLFAKGKGGNAKQGASQKAGGRQTRRN